MFPARNSRLAGSDFDRQRGHYRKRSEFVRGRICDFRGDFSCDTESWCCDQPTGTVRPDGCRCSGYNLYRSPSGVTTFQLLNSTPDSHTSYVDQAVQSGSSYTYHVKSVDTAGTESVASNQTTVTIP